jgi:hypothetical protein
MVILFQGTTMHTNKTADVSKFMHVTAFLDVNALMLRQSQLL